MRRFGLFISIAVILLFGSLLPAHAIDQADFDAIFGNTVWFDSSFSVGCSDDIFVGDNNAEIIYNNLVSKGFTKEQAAGFLGNFYVESKFDPTIISGVGATGLAQWERGRLDDLKGFAAGLGLATHLSLEAQLKFIWFELKAEPKVPGVDGGKEKYAYGKITDATTVEEAAWAVAAYYERNALSGDWRARYGYDSDREYAAFQNAQNNYDAFYEKSFRHRIEPAEAAYEQFGGSTFTPVVSQECTGSVGVGPDGFVFPVAGTQSEIRFNYTPGSHGYAWPGNGFIPYYAYDIEGAYQADVVASKAGTIRTYSPEYNCTDPQLSLWLEDDSGIWFFYQHLDATEQLVGVGDRVTAGQKIGVIGPNAYIGGTCDNTEPHLHFAASTVRTAMYRDCPKEDCPNMDKLIDIGETLKGAYDDLPE